MSGLPKTVAHLVIRYLENVEELKTEHEKQIMIETAKAEVESAKLRAEAIKLVGEMAQQFPEYREQEFIAAFGEAVQSGAIDQIIYVPTEAGIPIIEAGRAVRGEGRWDV